MLSRSAPGHRPLIALLGAGLAAVLAFDALAPGSQQVYLDTVETTSGWPAWTHTAWELASEGGLIVLALLLAVAAWRTRRSTPILLALLVGAGVVGAYAASEALKLLAEQPRPCDRYAVEVIASCPPAGDWSLPSNHATIAAALAAGVVALAPRLGWIAVPIGALVAASRVALGVHYPHDVLSGAALGGTAVALIALVSPLVLRAAGRLGSLTLAR